MHFHFKFDACPVLFTLWFLHWRNKVKHVSNILSEFTLKSKCAVILIYNWTAHLLLRVNSGKIMHTHFNFDATNAQNKA